MLTSIIDTDHPPTYDYVSAFNALQCIANYDCWRLKRYLEIGDPNRGSAISVGNAKVLRFRDVGYFNRVYHADASALSQLDEWIEQYYAAPAAFGRYGWEMVSAADYDLERDSRFLNTRGFTPTSQTARLGLALDAVDAKRRFPHELKRTREFSMSIRSPNRIEFEEILDLYLHGFGAPVANHCSAKSNMMQLFDQPDLHVFGCYDGSHLAGFGIMHIQPPFALLTAGVVRNAFRGRGIHHALIKHRISTAYQLGCQAMFTWATHGSVSSRHLQQHGFRILRCDRAWRWPAHAR